MVLPTQTDPFLPFRQLKRVLQRLKLSEGASQEWEQKNGSPLSLKGEGTRSALDPNMEEPSNAPWTAFVPLLTCDRATLGPHDCREGFSIPPKNSRSLLSRLLACSQLYHPPDPQLSLFPDSDIDVSTCKGLISPDAEPNRTMGPRANPRALIPLPPFILLLSQQNQQTALGLRT